MTLIKPSRRRFLFGAAALLAAPAIARAASLMPISTRNPILWGDGIHDDTAAINVALRDHAKKGGGIFHLPPGRYLTTATIIIPNRVILASREFGEAGIVADVPGGPALLIPKGVELGGLQNLNLRVSASTQYAVRIDAPVEGISLSDIHCESGTLTVLPLARPSPSA